MLERLHENDPGFIVAWHSKSKHQAGKFEGRVMNWGKAHRTAEQLQEEHPENTYWAEHIAPDYSHH